MLGPSTVLADRYEIERLLARGGMADVWLARDVVLDRDVAVKAVRAGETVERARFDAELRVQAALRHPHLVQLFDAGEHDGHPYLVLELADGPTLADLIADGPLEADRAAQIGGALANALAFVHARGVVHRDVKPSNVLTGRDGRVLLGDFGIARLADTTAITVAGTTVGSAAYMAPEQVAGEEVSSATDVYSLGLVLLECLTGARAFPGSAQESAFARLHRDPEIPSDLDDRWRGILAAMTARSPAERPPANDVSAWLTEGTDAEVTRALPADRTAVLPVPGVVPAVPAASARRPPPRLAPRDRRSDSSNVPASIAPALVAVLVVAALLLLIAAGAGLVNGPSSGPQASAQPPETTSAPTTTAVPTTTAPAEHDCSEVEEDKKALEEEKKDIEKEYRGDPDTREGLLEQLDQQKKLLEEEQKRCERAQQGDEDDEEGRDRSDD